MKTLIIPFMAAALLLLPACGNCRKPAARQYCPPTAPTRPICPPEKKACGKKKQPCKPCTSRHAVSLSEVMDYLPGLPPGYLSI